MQKILLGLLIIILCSCSGTGTDTPNTVFPTLGRVSIEVANVADKEIDVVQDSSLCIGSDEGVMCFANSYVDTAKVPETISGLKLLSRVTDKNNQPLVGAVFILADCNNRGNARKQYEFTSDSLGEIEFIAQDVNCYSLEVQAEVGESEKAYAFIDSLDINDQTDIEADMSYPVHISGKFQISEFPADKQFYVGLMGTNRSLFLKNGDTFLFYNVPKDVKYLFFQPFDGNIGDPAVAKEVYSATPIKIPINKENMTDLRQINLDFVSGL